MPPISVDLMPSDDPVGQRRVEEAWLEEHRRHLIAPSGREESLIGTAQRIARHFGFPPDRLDDGAALSVLARFPEIVLVPEELDFPRKCPPDRFYAGPCLALSRPDEPFWSLRVREDRPLVYCSFGTQIHRYCMLRTRLSQVVAAAHLLPAVEFLIASGIDYSEHLPANVTVVPRVPQLTVLRHSAAMISHGGLNGIKEALHFGVPLIVLPFDKDQPGNAARIAFHGLGCKADWDSLAATEFALLIRRVLDDTAIKRRVSTMSERFRRMHAEQCAAQAVIRCLAVRGLRRAEEIMTPPPR